MEINPCFKDNQLVQNFVQTLLDNFDKSGTTIFAARNIIKSFSISDTNIIVKRYKLPSWIQRVIYSFFRKSKAKRAFYNATELRGRGINTPQEIAFIEQWSKGLFQYGYYISGSDNAPPIREKLIVPENFDLIMAQDFAAFVAELHEKGILHHDLNSTNVLYHKCKDEHYKFSVIDINRMKFYPKGQRPSKKECFENLTRFTGRMDLFEYVVQNYAKRRNWNIENTVLEAIFTKKHHDEQWRKRKAFFRRFKSKK